MSFFDSIASDRFCCKDRSGGGVCTPAGNGGNSGGGEARV